MNHKHKSKAMKNKYGITDKHMRHVRSIEEDDETITIVFNKPVKSAPTERKRPPIGKHERRTFSAPVHLRADAEDEDGKKSRTIEGYAAVFNVQTDMGWWKEQIAPGAFADVLKDDVRALFNHDPNLILARSNNTLELWQDEKGLGYRFEAPETSAGNDLLENVRNGNITQSSFGFTISEYEWRDLGEDEELFTIIKIGRLYDVSPVTYPAYETTEVTARSMDAFLAEKRGEEEGAQGGGAEAQSSGEDQDSTQGQGESERPTTVEDDIEFYKMRLREIE